VAKQSCKGVKQRIALLDDNRYNDIIQISGLAAFGADGIADMKGVMIFVTEVKFVRDTFPTAAFPFYGTMLQVTGLEENCRIERIEVNGQWVRDYYIFCDGQKNEKYELLAGAGSVAVYVSTDWTTGDSIEIAIRLKGDGEAQAELVSNAHTAAGQGGYWDKSYQYYACVIVYNDTGYPRSNEPVHQPMAVYADRVTDPLKEVRVVHVDRAGVHTEIPSQVYDVHIWEQFSDIHCQPTCNFDVAFFTGVDAHSTGTYLVFYGNAEARAAKYETDLKVSGEGFALHIENEYYAVNLHDVSGSIFDVAIKQGVNQVFAHGLETNGTVNWNPDIYAPPVPWNHISDWAPPQEYAVIRGTVFCMVKRWGTMPMYDDVLCSVTYIFYAGYKPIIIETTMELTKSRGVLALRNGEIVVNKELADGVAWKNIDGTVQSSPILDLPRHPTCGKYLHRNTPWVALFNRNLKAAIGVVYIEDVNIRKDGGLTRADPHIYIHHGPWIYVARPILYTFVGNNPQRVMHAHGNTINYEKLAWLPFAMGTGEDAFEPIESANAHLRSPLNRRVFLDTDKRAPMEWIPPILLEEFEEIE
jgi:hypothetical protein